MPPGIVTTMTSVGMSMRFDVVVDGNVSLGSWATCKGLSLEIKTKLQTSGGYYDGPTILIDKIAVFKPVVLERVVTKQGSDELWKWLVEKTSGFDAFKKGTACITLMDHTNAEVTKWELHGVFPTKWEGPALDAAAKKVALEKLTLSHEGFLNLNLDLP